MGKYFTPVVIVLIMLVLLFLYVSIFFSDTAGAYIPVSARIIAGGVFLVIGGGLLIVLWQRIREIKRGDEDDLGKY